MSRYIDADELLKRLSRKEADEGAALVNFVKKVVELRIKAMPTADVEEVKRGRWLVQDKGIIVTSYCCSECGEVVRDDTGYDVAIDYPYCHCGAKMRNEDDE